MEQDKGYVGKVVNVQYLFRGNVCSKIGYVYDQKKIGEKTEFRMCLKNGTEWTQSLSPEDIIKISSVRMDKDLRDALKTLGDARTKQEAFLKHFWEEKYQIERNVENARTALQDISGELTTSDFMKEVRNLFSEAFPASGDFQRERYFECTSCGPKDITVAHVQEVMKWATPEKFPFLYREYDGVIFADSKHPDYKRFCERYAPAPIPHLSAATKTSVGASVGDKNFLTSERYYTILLKHGLTKASLQDIKDLISGKSRSAQPAKKPSLDIAIKAAAGRAEKQTSDKGKEKGGQQR